MPIEIAKGRQFNIIRDFLKRPDIDTSFVKPLSERNITIDQRVRMYQYYGIWIMGHDDNEVYGCIAVKCQKEAAYLSTYALRPDALNKGLALLDYALKYAVDNYHAKMIDTDSWENNRVVDFILKRKGFRVDSVYDDPIKRPDGVKTVYYILKI
jgi:hypothetical protein